MTPGFVRSFGIKMVVAITIASLGLLSPSTASAQTSPDDSRFRATVYGFIPSLGAKTAFPTPLGSTIDVDAQTLLKNTDFALMGVFEVQRERWGAFTDLMYFNVGTTKSGSVDLAVAGVPIPVPVTANATIDMEAWVWTVAASLRAVSAPRVTLDVFGGARRLEATGALEYSFSSDVGPFAGQNREGSSEAANASWDGIAGAKGRLTMRRLFITYYADAGLGQSDLTWQAMAGGGYAFRHVEVGGVWRHLAYDMKSDRMLAELTFNGPAAGITFKW